MKNYISLLFITFITTLALNNVHSQTRQYGKLSKEDIELQEYTLDKEAEAVVLFDIGKSFFVKGENGFDLVFERTTRIKILNESGLHYAEIEIPLYQEGTIFEEIYDLDAQAYNIENGQIIATKLETKKVFTEKINNFWTLKKFAIPNVKKGTIIEYKYKINSQYIFNLRDWNFQWRIPVIYSEYEVKMVPFYEYTWLLLNAKKFDNYVSYTDNGMKERFGNIEYNDLVHKYIMQNIPAFNGEEFISTINDYIIKIDFQLSKIYKPSGQVIQILTTWDKMIKEYLEHDNLGKYIDKCEKQAIKQINIDELKSLPDSLKFNYVLNYIKKNYNWNNYVSVYASKSVKKFIEEKTGNSADINLFAIGLLRSVGIKASPVILSTRDHGKILYDYPYAHFFNNVIILAEFNNQRILTDATEPLNPNTVIPAKCINDKGLILQDDKVEWMNLTSSQTSEIEIHINTSIYENIEFKSDVSIKSSLYEAIAYKKNYAENKPALVKQFGGSGYTIEENTIQFKNHYIPDSAFLISYTMLGKSEVLNDKIYVAPFHNLAIDENPLKQKERTYPIDFTYPVKRTYKVNIQIPDGYNIEYIPSEQAFSNTLYDFSYKTVVNASDITITCSYYLKKSVYPNTDYARMKYFFGEIVKKTTDKIVLVKKE